MTKPFFGILVAFLFYGSYSSFVHFWIAFAENNFEDMIWESFLLIVCIAGACAVYAAWRELRKSRRRAET